MGNKRLDYLSDLCRYRMTMRVICLSCGRQRAIRPMALVMSGVRENTSVEVIVKRLKCSNCRSRRVDCFLQLPGPGG